MSIIAILALIAMMCAAIYLTAIYALPILAGLAAYSLLNQIDASAPTIAIVAIASGIAAFAAARAGASARHGVVRLATLALIAAPAGYAGYSATLQLARAFGVPEEWWTLLSVVATLAVPALTIDMVGKPAPAAQRRPDVGRPIPAMLPAQAVVSVQCQCRRRLTTASGRTCARRLRARRH